VTIGNSDLALRPVTAADAAAVSAIYAHHVEHGVATFDLEAPGPEAWTAKATDLAAAGWPFLVAVEAGEVVGFAYVSAWRARPAYRHTVEDLAPGRSGRGIGRALLREVLARAAAAGAEQSIAVIADSGDPSSMALHRALGFTEAGRLRRVGHKHGRVLDVVLMQAELG
jgi:L-amino acid N-acyltransferase YncA